MQKVPRLYETFQPSHYDLHLTVEREKRIFSGNVVVQGDHSAEHGDITLHAKGLAITRALLNETPLEFVIDAENDALILKTSEIVSDGAVRLTVDFSGKITDSLHGLYPCYYELEGVKKEVLVTQFESHHAREVFPCIDEPEAKATFDLTLTTETTVAVLGNMPVKSSVVSRQESVETQTTTFETSPRMSVYLLAFVIGDLQSKSTKTKSGVEVTTWATKAQSADSLDFALDTAKRCIEFFDEYFGIPYPLPKSDHVALPDFSSGAMENWGLITYREMCLLVEKTSAVSTRQYVATVIAHESSHQWFGNLVTMKWWDDLWLNESFATLMEHVCVDALFPSWKTWTTFATQESLAALRRDYLPGIQAIKTAVNHPDEISTLFDPSIVYAKGARVLAMLRAYVGEDVFRAGLSNYFKKYAYQNTVGSDLWKSLSEVAGEDIDAFMKPWLEQSGMPVVSVTRDGDTLHLTQKRFVIPAAVGDATWPIPLNGFPESVPRLLASPSSSIELSDETSLVLINHEATTHAIVNYDETSLEQLEKALEDGKLDVVDRLSLLHDMSLLARSGEQTATNLLTLLKRYHHETSEPVWSIISLAISDLRRLTEEDEDAENALKQLVGKLALPTYERLGWDEKKGEDESDTKLRAIAIGLLGFSENKEIIDKCREVFARAGSALHLPGELRAVIITVVVRHGTVSDVERLIEEYRATSSSELQNDIASSLTSTKDHGLINRLIEKLTDESFVRRQDLFRWFAWLMRNRHGREATWEWMVKHWDWIETTFSGDKSYDGFARYSASALSTKEWLIRYETFFADKRSITALTRTIDLGVADIMVRADWFERDAAALCDALKSEEAS